MAIIGPRPVNTITLGVRLLKRLTRKTVVQILHVTKINVQYIRYLHDSNRDIIDG